MNWKDERESQIVKIHETEILEWLQILVMTRSRDYGSK